MHLGTQRTHTHFDEQQRRREAVDSGGLAARGAAAAHLPGVWQHRTAAQCGRVPAAAARPACKGAAPPTRQHKEMKFAWKAQSGALGLGLRAPQYTDHMWAEVHGAKGSKTLSDPLHCMVTLEPAALAIVDTPHFQRLRDLKQLGAVPFVFPAGSHARFEHSVGVYHLAGAMIGRFAATQPELGITVAEQEAVRLAGLCHDLGHGPFSHVFDNEFIPAVRPGSSWTHERMSADLLQVLVDDNGIDMEAAQLRLVQDLIAGAPGSGSGGDRAFLYDIVANKRNGVDVDKFDYLGRDAHHMGLKTTYDYRRLLGASKVLDGQVCFHAREAWTVYELFHTRYSLFKQVYCHRATKAIEYMITDALVEADAAWGRRLSSAIDDPRAYYKLTDYVLHEIEASTAPELSAARAIFGRMRRRQLYAFVDEALIPEAVAAGLAKVTPQMLGLRPQDVIVQDYALNYGSYAHNPVDATMFYDGASTAPYALAQGAVSCLLPAHFQERIVRVYARDKAHVPVAAAAFAAFVRTHCA
jgi:HD superfamily phosphohydrolase